MVESNRSCARLASWLLAAACAAGCGGTASAPKSAAEWVDPAYHSSPTVLVSLAIAPTPVSGATADQLDQGFERAFLATPGLELRGQPSFFRQRMNGDRALLQIITRVAAQEYSAQDLAGGVGLGRTLSPKEIQDLRDALNGCGMMLMPLEFTTTPAAKSTTGHARCRVYDLNSGKLLLQNAYDISVSEGGIGGDRRAAVDLILAIQSDFEKHLIYSPK